MVRVAQRPSIPTQQPATDYVDTPIPSGDGSILIRSMPRDMSVEPERKPQRKIGEIRPLVDEDVDDGVPDLLGLAGGGGWIAVSSIKGWQSLGRIDDRGVVLGAVAPESSLGHAEAIAAVGDRLLLATPEGRAMRLRVVACSETAAPVAPDPAAPPAAD